MAFPLASIVLAEIYLSRISALLPTATIFHLLQQMLQPLGTAINRINNPIMDNDIHLFLLLAGNQTQT